MLPKGMFQTGFVMRQLYRSMLLGELSAGIDLPHMALKSSPQVLPEEDLYPRYR
jgi:hypothetical protein